MQPLLRSYKAVIAKDLKASRELSSDTHWNDIGGASLLTPLQQTLSALGVGQK